jgi:hypothetical protein
MNIKNVAVFATLREKKYLATTLREKNIPHRRYEHKEKFVAIFAT